ncbi:MAG: YiiX/YebB-like N1pC/P60 family cysteine hydrolase [Candidatus Eremiobacteraeota bacterium]|nr:YiiX/YebB-like N1pC/P60 family cysteine hydrolase [Candidatus Eremiobacteraeota bacterium]
MDPVQRAFSRYWVRPEPPDPSTLDGKALHKDPADSVDLSGNNKPGTNVRELPTNLELPSPLKKRGRLMSALQEGLFTACSLTYLGGCALAAVVPNLVSKLTQKTFTEAQINEMKAHLQPGDIILTKSDMHRTFYFLVHSTYGHDFSHAATYAGEGQIIDSYDKPDRQDIGTFFQKMTDIAVLRPRYASKKQVDRSIRYLEEQIGKKYDMKFRTDDVKEFYCSELTLRGLEASGLDTKVPGHSVLGHAFVLPDDFKHSKDIDLVKVFHSEEE